MLDLCPVQVNVLALIDVLGGSSVSSNLVGLLAVVAVLGMLALFFGERLFVIGIQVEDTEECTTG